MPRGPQGQQRPGDVVGAAVTVARIATGEQDEQFEVRTAGQILGRSGGQARAIRVGGRGSGSCGLCRPGGNPELVHDHPGTPFTASSLPTALY